MAPPRPAESGVSTVARDSRELAHRAGEIFPLRTIRSRQTRGTADENQPTPRGGRKTDPCLAARSRKEGRADFAPANQWPTRPRPRGSIRAADGWPPGCRNRAAAVHTIDRGISGGPGSNPAIFARRPAPAGHDNPGTGPLFHELDETLHCVLGTYRPAHRTRRSVHWVYCSGSTFGPGGPVSSPVGYRPRRFHSHAAHAHDESSGM